MSNSNKESSVNKANLNNISFSSVETQKKLRIEKISKIKALGQDPYTPNSKRDFTLGMVKFWFNFIHKFDIKKLVDEDEELYNFDYFLHQVIFPRSLLEKMEERIHLRYTVRQMGLDPDEESAGFNEEYDEEYIDEARKLLPNLLTLSDDSKHKYLREYLTYVGEDEDEDENPELRITLQPNQYVHLAGRLKSKRVSGKIAFGTVEDESCPEGFQFIFKKDDLPETGNSESLSFEDYKNLIDEGDYIQAYGKLDYSQRGEPSLFVEKLVILTKVLRSVPETLEDKEIRFRKRYTDMRVNSEVRELLVKKSVFWSATKQFMDDNGFLQVEAPVLQETTGGAEANPFITHHQALDTDLYLGISPELHLKRFIAGGFEKVYDLGRNFRNEGIDDEHLQEFTRVEFYWAYASHDQLMEFTEKMMKFSLEKAFGTLNIVYKPKNEKGEFTGEEITVDWNKTWPKISYYDFIQKYGGVDLRSCSNLEELKQVATDLGVKFNPETDGFGRITDLIYKKIARPKCIEPTWLIDVPTRMSPLAKRDPNNPESSLRSHLLAIGSELTNGFSELNDPIDQLDRFLEQQALRDGGDSEAMMLDRDYIEALEQGIPPTVGFAYSERLFSLVANKTLRECSPFPLMRKSDDDKKTKAKRTMVAHAVILDNAELPTWAKLNAAAHLSASFASREGKKLIHIDSCETLDGEEIPMNIQHAIIMKKSDSVENLRALKLQAEKQGLTVSCFTEDMMSSSNDEKVVALQSQKKANQIKYLGVLVFGKKSDVENLTNQFELFE